MREPKSVLSSWGEGVLKMADMSDLYAPGMFVRHPTEPDWGLGQVQSNVQGKVTVNFENQGKVVINSGEVELMIAFDV